MLRLIITLVAICTYTNIFAAQIKVEETNSALSKGQFSLHYKIIWQDKNGDRNVSENNIGPAPITQPKHKDFSELNTILAGLNNALEHNIILSSDVHFNLNCKNGRSRKYHFTTAPLKQNRTLTLHAPAQCNS